MHTLTTYAYPFTQGRLKKCWNALGKLQEKTVIKIKNNTVTAHPFHQRISSIEETIHRANQLARLDGSQFPYKLQKM